MNKYGLIGKTLCHSYSKDFFDQKFINENIPNCSYELYELANVHNLRQWAINNDLQGFNVTMPYKEVVLPQMATLSAEAEIIGAVNTVRVLNGQLWGYNTDAPAFESTLYPLLQSWHTSALILGTGGAAKAVAYTLHKLDIDYRFVSRTQHNAKTLNYTQAITAAKNCFLIINATPIGMYPNDTVTPWNDTHTLSTKHLCYDLVYNPAKTLFLIQAELVGSTIQNGLPMLYRQAELSWNLWQNTFETTHEP